MDSDSDSLETEQQPTRKSPFIEDGDETDKKEIDVQDESKRDSLVENVRRNAEKEDDQEELAYESVAQRDQKEKELPNSDPASPVLDRHEMNRNRSSGKKDSHRRGDDEEVSPPAAAKPLHNRVNGLKAFGSKNHVRDEDEEEEEESEEDDDDEEEDEEDDMESSLPDRSPQQKRGSHLAAGLKQNFRRSELRASDRSIDRQRGQLDDSGARSTNSSNDTSLNLRDSRLGWERASSTKADGGKSEFSGRDVDMSYSTSSLQETRSCPSLTRAPGLIEEDRISYLVGRLGTKHSLLGSQEMNQVLPEGIVKIFIGTLNTCGLKVGKDNPSNLRDFFLPDLTSIDQRQDIYVIGTQESGSNKREWEIRIQATLGPKYVMVESSEHGALHIAIFVRRELAWYISVSEHALVTTRAVSTVKTKGGLGICFYLFGTSFLFICSHFRSGDKNAKSRLSDYKTIARKLDLPKVAPASREHRGDVTKRFDCVFWFGDLNFRLCKDRKTVETIVGGIQAQSDANYEALLTHDELTEGMQHDRLFHGFHEGRITFPPSYKYDIGTDTFDTSSKCRVPSYTDRVLFRSRAKGSINCMAYNSVMSMQCSDHKPVYAVFHVAVKPGSDRIPLSYCDFDRKLYHLGMERRAEEREAAIHNQRNKPSTTCVLQ